MIRKKLVIIIFFAFNLLFVRNLGAIDWATRTIDSYGDVGKHTSLALDKDGWPHISYLDATHTALKYAYKDASGWHITTAVSSGRNDYYTSIALDNVGYPHIIHGDSYYWRLKYTYQDASGWHTEQIGENGDGRYGFSIALDNHDYPHISCSNENTRYLIYLYKDGSGWHRETRDHFGVCGRYSSIALDNYGYPHISYFDDSNDNLRYAYKDASGWVLTTVEYTGDHVGSWTSIALNSLDYPHISYYDDSNSDLKYAYKDEPGWRWHIETVDSYGGRYTSIALDKDGWPHISYYDDSNSDLKYAYKDESGWHLHTVESYNNVGYWSSIALNYYGEPHISYYDDTNDDLKFARLQTYGPGPFTILSPSNGSWTNTEPTFMWEPCSYQGDNLSRYELWIDGIWNKNLPKTRIFTEPASALSSGWHTWKVKAVKLDGNSIWSNESWSVRIDATYPINFNINSPDDSTWTNDRTPTFTWQSSADAESGLKEYLFYIDGSLAKTGISPDSTSITPLWNYGLSSGDHTWYIVAVDNAGNITQSNQTRTIKIDYTGPNYLFLLSPSHSSYIGVDTPTFKWKSTTDEGIGISQYQLWIDNSIIDSISANVELDTMTFTIDTSMTLNHGLHTWYIKAFDKLGNYRDSPGRYLYIDLKPPNPFSLQTPVDSAIVSLPTPNFNWYSTLDYTPTASGFAKYQLWIDDSLNVDNVTSNSTAPSARLTEGYHSWFVKAIDNVGNVRNSIETWNVILEWNPPITFDLASPANGDTVLLSSPVLFWHPSSDAGSGIQKYQLWINTNLNRDNILPADTSTIPVNPLENGQYNWFVKALDFSGNTTSSTSIRSFVVDVDYIPPISQITYPSNVDTIDGVSIEIQGISTDGTGIGVDSVFVSTNNGQSWHLVQKINENYDNWTYLWKNLNYGDYTIKSRAKDFAGNLEIPGDSIRVHVKNSLPFIDNPLPDLTLIEGGPDTSLLSLNSVFSDLNVGDTLSYRYGVIPSTAGIHITINEITYIPTVHLEKNWNGNAQVIFIAFDNQFDIVRDTMIVNVLPINDVPVITSADRVSATEDIYFKYLATASDIEDSSINFTFESLSCWLSADADSVYGTPSEGIKDTSFVVIASDGELNDTMTVFLEIISVNDPPIISSIPDTSFNEDGQLKFPISYFSNFVYDPDNADSTFTWSFSDTDYVYITMDRDSVILSSQINWFGKDSLFTIVSDGEFSDEASFLITVYPVNDPPYFTELMPDSILFDSNVRDTLLLTELASDIDNPDTSLVWSYIHSSFVCCHINDTMKTAMFWVEENLSGQDTIILSIFDGEFTAYDSLIVKVNPITGVEYLMSQIPKEYFLKQNYPNPFNPTTTIIYALPERSDVDIRIYNLTGREVISLVNNNQEAKYYKVIWNAKDRSGNNVPSGMYFYRIVVKSDNSVFIQVKKMLLLR